MASTNVLKFKKKEALTITCSACGKIGVAGCECGVEYVPAGKRAEAAVLANPRKSDRAIAKEIGVSDKTVAKARKPATAENSAVPVLTKHAKAEAAIIQSPDKTSAAIAKRIGVDEKTVRRARKALQLKQTSASAPVEPKALDMVVVKQANAFHVELYESLDDFCTRLEKWFERNAELPEPAFQTLYNALESNSMRLQRLAQKLDGR